MIIYFLTKEYEACCRVGEVFSDSGHSVFVYSTVVELIRKLGKEGRDRVDLIACDYRIFGPDAFDPYKYMVEKDFVVPMIFYNDPFAPRENRSMYWYESNMKRFSDAITVDCLDRITPLLLEFQSVINNPDVESTLSLICPPKTDEKIKDMSSFSLQDFKFKYEIQDSKFQVFEYLFRHRNTAVSVEELCIHLWKEKSKSKINTLYSYISVLKEVCLMDTDFYLRICRISKGQYMLRASERFSNVMDVSEQKKF